MVCPGVRPGPVEGELTGQQPSDPEPPVPGLEDLQLPGEGGILSPEQTIQLMILGEYGILQEYLDRQLRELFEPEG